MKQVGYTVYDSGEIFHHLMNYIKITPGARKRLENSSFVVKPGHYPYRAVFKNNLNEPYFNDFVMKRFGNEIRKFDEVMSSHFNNYDLVHYHNNIRTLKIHYYDFIVEKILDRSSISGEYSPTRNTISIAKDTYEYSIFHELMHMASSYVYKGVFYSGFSQHSTKKGNEVQLGRVLNEGYTELMTRRYFGHDENTETYEMESFLAGQLEKVVGKEIMESLFLKADLKGLINELSKYSSVDKAIEFVHYLDMTGSTKDTNTRAFYFRNIVGYLIDIYVAKYLAANNYMVTEQEDKDMRKFVDDLTFTLKVRGKENEKGIPINGASMFNDIIRKKKSEMHR